LAIWTVEVAHRDFVGHLGDATVKIIGQDKIIPIALRFHRLDPRLRQNWIELHYLSCHPVAITFLLPGIALRGAISMSDRQPSGAL
jgi:hypothetical protein